MQMRLRQTGLSMIELMIAMTIGLLIMAGMATLFVQTKSSFRQDEIVARMQEEARFALMEMSADISMSGFWGPILDGAQLTNDAGIATAGRFTNYTVPVQSLDNTSSTGTFDWAALDDLKTGTDALSVRRLAGSIAASLNTGSFYMETNGTTAKMVPGTVTMQADHEYWEYHPVIYYVRTFCRTGDGIPSLVKHYWVNGTQRTACIAQGVENMQLEFGLDVNGDGYPERYVTSVGAANASQVSTVRIFLLARATQEDQYYVNAKTYNLSNAAALNENDKYYRRVYGTTVQTRNVINLRGL